MLVSLDFRIHLGLLHSQFEDCERIHSLQYSTLKLAKRYEAITEGGTVYHQEVISLHEGEFPG